MKFSPPDQQLTIYAIRMGITIQAAMIMSIKKPAERRT